jgi:TatD DNase family protein
MISTHPFINLHSHRKPQLENELVVRNAFVTSQEKLSHISYPISCGIHPWLITNNYLEKLNQLNELLAHIPNVCAVGECGLDKLKGPSIELQLEIFHAHIELANQFNKPLILHLVKTYSDILHISNVIKVPFIVHGFKGNSIEAEQLIQKGACLSFGPRLLNDTQLQDTFTQLPIEKIYLETDTKPISIADMYKAASTLKNLSIDALRTAICNNFARDFNK